MNVSIKIIPHNKQRYNTAGDWLFTPLGDLVIYVSEMGDWKKEMCVAYHELFEVLLCKDRGITQEQVDAFDIQFEEERSVGLHAPTDEPGYDSKAPYKKEHFCAEIPERFLAHELHVDWQEYSDIISEL